MKRTIASTLAAALLGGMLIMAAEAAPAPAAATPAAAPATPAPAASTATKPAPAPVHHKKKKAAKPAAAPAVATKPAAAPAAAAPVAAAPAPAPAPTNVTPVAGSATLVTGHVSAATPAGEIRDLEKGGPVYPGETITTASASYVNIEFTDGGRVLLRPETRFAIERYQYAGGAQAPAQPQGQAQTSAQPAQQESAFFRLLKGGFRAVSGLIGHTRREDYAVQTPVATIGIRGTDYEVRLCAADCADITPTPKDGLYGGVQSGAIALDNAGGTTNTTAGQYVFISGVNSAGQPLATRPAALGQPLPDPKTCN